MSSNQPTIILCSGAWHTEFHIRPVIPHFEKAGYRFIPCPLLSAGSKADSDETIGAIQTAAEKELAAGHDVCLLLHSAAGLIGTEAVNRALANVANTRGKILHVIYVATFLDRTVIVKYLMDDGHIDIDMETGTSRAAKPRQGFYHELADDKAQPFVEALTWQYHTNFELSSEAYRDVPKTHLICTKDQVFGVEMQQACARDYGMAEATIDSGHCPFTTVPADFVAAVKKILSESS